MKSPLSVELGNENVVVPHGIEVEVARPRVEVSGAFEGANGVDVAAAVHGNARRLDRECPTDSLGPEETAGTVELGNEDVVESRGCKVEDPLPWVEVAGTAKPAHCVDVAALVQRYGASLRESHSCAHRPGPDEIAGAVELGDKDS